MSDSDSDFQAPKKVDKKKKVAKKEEVSDDESEQPKVDKKKKTQKRDISSSGDEGVNDPTPLKKKKSDDGDQFTTIKNAEGTEMVEIGKMKYACVRSFKGQTYVDIREYYMDNKDGKMKPGKKGISLSTEQYANFKKTIGYIDEKIATIESVSDPTSECTQQQLLHAHPRPRFNSLAEAFGVQQQEQQQSTANQPLHNINRIANMSNEPPIPGNSLASRQQQTSQGFEGMAESASSFPPHMQQQYAAHSSQAAMTASPVHGMPPPQSPIISPSPNSFGQPGGSGMHPHAPPTPQRPSMPHFQSMPLTPGSMPMHVPPGTPGGCGPTTPQPMTPQSQQQMQLMQQQQHHQQMMQQQHQLQQQRMQQMQMKQMQPGMTLPGQVQMQQQMVGQSMQQQGMLPGQMMVMSQQGQMMQGQRPYGFPPGQQFPAQQQMMPPQFVTGPQMMGGAGMQAGVAPQRVMIQRVPPAYPQGTIPPQQQQMPPGPQYAMPPQYSPNVYPQAAPQLQQQHPPGTPQTPVTPQTARFPPGTPTNGSPFHGTPQQQQLLQQQQLVQQSSGGVVGPPPGTPGTPVQQQQQVVMRSPQLTSPSQAQMMQQAQQQQMVHTMQQQQQVPQSPQQPTAVMQQKIVAAPPMHPYLARNHGMNISPDKTLVGCHFVVLDWERYETETTDKDAIEHMVRLLGGDIEFGPKAYEKHVERQTHNMVTHGIISYLLFPRRQPCQPIEAALNAMVKDGKRIVTMQWLVDVVEQRKMDVPWKIAHLPVPMPLENMRTNHGRIISVSGFPEGERSAVKYMVEAIGAKMMPGLSQHTHLLISKNPSSEKFEKAREWGVPTVNLQWLVDAYLGQPPLDMEHPRYQVSLQSPIEINCGPFTLEMLHVHYKHCLAAWRIPVPCSNEQWHRAMLKQQEIENKNIFPLKRLKMISSPAPSEEEITAAHENEPPTADRKQFAVAFEGFDEELEDAMGRKIRMLGGTIASSIEKCTHLVAIDGKRTVGLLKALALGKNVVSPGWVNTSYDQRQFADTFDFFLHDEDSEKVHNCNFKLSVMRARQSGVFEDCEFYITPSVDPSPSIVGELVQLGGGVVHSQPPSPAKFIECLETDKPFLLIATECDMPILKYLTDAGVSVFSTELVFSALMRQEVEVLPEYVVSPDSCAPSPLRLPAMGVAGRANVEAEFVSSQKPQVKAN